MNQWFVDVSAFGPGSLPAGREGSLGVCLFLLDPGGTETKIILKALSGVLRDRVYMRFVFNFSAGSLFLESVNGGKCQSRNRKRRNN